MAFRLGIKESIAFVPSQIKKQFADVTKKMDTETFFGDDSWLKTKTRQFQCKISKDNLDIALKNLKKIDPTHEKKRLKGKSAINFSLGEYKVQFQETGKMASVANANTTRQQELASLWMIKMALKSGGRIYKDIEDLKSDRKGFSELIKIYPSLDENVKWMKGLIAQQKTVGKKLKEGHYTVFNRDGGFMEFISNLVKRKFGISQKDTWNPADIWIIKDQQGVIRELESALEGKYSQIEKLNAIMRRMWKDKKLKGISLKAISGKVAKWEEVNVEEMLFTESNKPPVFEVQEKIIKLSMKNDSQFTSQDTVIMVKEGSSEYKFQIKANSRGFSNLKFEPTATKASAARLGKVPLNMLTKLLLEDYKIKFKNKNSFYPRTVEEFEKQERKYITIWRKLHLKGVKTEIASEEELLDNIKKVFVTEPDIAQSKLMQLTFLNSIVSLSKAKLNALFTDMIFLAMKRGRKFGPFGKLS